MPINKSQAKGVRVGFAEWAEEYDADTGSWMRWAAPEALAEWLRPCLRDGERVLDLGCGTGQSPPLYRPKRLEWTGADLSSEMLSIARKSGHYAALRRMNVERRRYPFDADSFDAVLACGVFEFTDRLESIAKELARVTRPGGRLALTVEAAPRGVPFDVFESEEYHYIRYRYGLDRVQELLENAGYEVEKRDTLIGYYDENETAVRYGRFLAERT